jgi:FkbM family methyltransferase
VEKRLSAVGIEPVATVVRRGYRVTARLYQLALFLWFTRRSINWFRREVYVPLWSPLNRLSQTFSEKLRIFVFMVKWTLVTHHFVSSRFMPLLRQDTPVVLQGTKYFVEPGAQEIFGFLEVYHDHDYDRVADFVPAAGWTILDVGANVGVFAIQQACRGAHVFAFEPNPDCYRRLSRAVMENGLSSQVSVFDHAIGSALGLGTLVVPGGVTSSGSIEPAEDYPAGKATVKVTSLDHVVPTLDVTRIDLLKIDTEGAEVEVLHGAEQTLSIVDRIVLEYHSRDLLEQVRALLHSHQFVEVLQADSDVNAGVGILYARRSR